MRSIFKRRGNVRTACALALVLLATSSLTLAQTNGIGQSASGSLASLQAKQTALQNSLGLFADHQFAAAESALESANSASAGTPDWHLESGAALIQVAAQFHAAGDGPTCGSVLNLALGHLLQADQLYGGGGSAANIAGEKALLGFFYEHYLTDRSTAKGYYQAALAADPGCQQAAQALDRIERIQAIEQQRFGSGFNSGK